MKAYTSIEQSKKLAEILPIESADMWYCPYPNDVDWYDEPRIGKAELLLNQLPCWSLAALLSVLPEPSLIQNQEGKWLVRSWDRKRFPWSVGGYNNAIDACVDMIEKLHKQKLL